MAFALRHQNMTYTFRKAESADQAQIWAILQQAIIRRKKDGSRQWQDGYPNENVVAKDLKNGFGYVICEGVNIAGYVAIIFNAEPAYDKIEGSWLTNGEFLVVHRLAVSEQYAGRGLAKKILDHTEELALKNQIFSVKADTNFDNVAMLKTFERAGYQYCGKVTFNGSPREAFEKRLG